MGTGVKDRLHWENLKFFAQLAEDKTVRAAAASLGVHHATVGRHLDELEQSLDLKLFLRTPDGYLLTEAGKLLLEDVTRIHTQLSETRRRLDGTDSRLSGSLRITMTVPTFTLIFAERMVEFTETFPNLELEMVSGVGFLDINRRGADVAIRMDNAPTENLVGKRMMSYGQTVYCAPDYAAQTGFRDDPTQGRWLRWRQTEDEFPEWSQSDAFATMPRWGNFDDVSVLQSAAAQGMGVALLPCLLGDSDPGLVRATDMPPTPGREIWVLTHQDLRNSAKVRAFMGFAEQVLRDARPQILGEVPPGA